MRYSLEEQQCQNLAVSKRREWMLANGIGGYAMGTPSGANTRRYHGLLVAAIDPPGNRMVLLAGIDAFVQTGLANPIGISTNQYQGALYPEGYLYLKHFHVDQEAVWIYRAGDCEIERSVRLRQGENVCAIDYANIGERKFSLSLRPLVSHKFYHGNFKESSEYPEALHLLRDKTQISQSGVDLLLSHPKAERTPIQGWYYRFEHEEELARGLDSRDDLFCPCELRYELEPGETVTLAASLQESHRPWPRPRPEARTVAMGEMLRDAASKFVVQAPGRSTVIAGYPWFADWGRDTMISIPGLYLHCGKVAQAREVLLDYARHMKDGLIPNRFTEEGGADYNTVDATLWYVDAVYRTLAAEWSEDFAVRSFDSICEALDAHLAGTRFGIRVDPDDGLLMQGESGLQLTWMDAKIGDWIVTPRHGKPIEVNALWTNALRIADWLAGRLGREAAEYKAAADLAESCFDAKFWHEGRKHYIDTVDPVDASLRPNQVIAMAVPFSPISGTHGRQALAVVERELLTPFGLRTLGPREPGYRGRYEGTLPELDSAYHQGTVWPWLLGPYCAALARLRGDRAECRRILKAARVMLAQRGLGGISEVYDGDEPQAPGGCPWQAWSVAEMLRAWIEDAEGD